MTAERRPLGTIHVDGLKKSFRRYHSRSLKESLALLARGERLYEQRPVLCGVDLHIRPGERLGLVGKNGAGKSTLFRILSGILEPDEGTVQVTGRVSPVIEVTAGLVPDMTGEENLRLNATLLGLSGEALERRLPEIVAFSGLEDFLETPCRYYSSGMQARLGFSVAVHVDANVLLVDEALSVGDVDFQAKCLARMHQVAEAGTTVLFVSHDPAAVAGFCTRVVELRDGICAPRVAGTPA